MGWLGWTEDQTLNTSMPAIEIAYRAKVEMLKACFGGGPSETDKPQEGMKPTAENLRQAFLVAGAYPK